MSDVHTSSAKYFEDYGVGQRFVSRGRTIADADIRMFVGATGADHPNHTDEEYCKAHPILERVCAHGLLVLGLVDGLITSELTQRMGPSMNYGHEKVRYVKPVYVGDTIHAQIDVVECRPRDDEWGLVRIEARAVNQRGDVAVFDDHVLIVQRRAAADPSYRVPGDLVAGAPAR